jgi:uncharacterized protein YutE (UPF0331/DUF86 family)
MKRTDRISIHRKLKSLMKYLNALKSFESLQLNEYLNNFSTQLAVERLLELIIQASLDSNRLLLKRLHESSPKENSEVFLASARFGLITLELGEQLAEFGKFRNVLAHLYEDIDPVEVFYTIQETLEIYPQYVKQIKTYVDSLEVEDEL